MGKVSKSRTTKVRDLDKLAIDRRRGGCDGLKMKESIPPFWQQLMSPNLGCDPWEREGSLQKQLKVPFLATHQLVSLESDLEKMKYFDYFCICTY